MNCLRCKKVLSEENEFLKFCDPCGNDQAIESEIACHTSEIERLKSMIRFNWPTEATRKIAVNIDCEKALCGNCQHRVRAGGENFCDLFGGKILEVNLIQKSLRLDRCIRSEIK